MDSGKRKAPDDGDERQRKCRRDYKIVVRQFYPLMEKINEWLEQHNEPPEAIPVSDVEDKAPPGKVRSGEGLGDTLRRFLAELDGDSTTRVSEGDATERKPETSSSEAGKIVTTP